jgi:hypothetical protein
VAASELEKSGAALRVEAASWRLQAVLLPDSVDTTALRAPWSRVSDNLAVSTGTASAVSVSLPREKTASGAPITLTQLSIDGKG